jgi:citrate synthase
VASWLAESFAAKRVIMGFGHRIYKHGDSRVPTMRVALGRLAELHHADQLMALYDNLEAAMLAAKDIYPNLDYPSGLAYHLMGFDISTFTPIFVMARITGWTAHIMEQLAGNSLIRPLGKYLGPDERPVPTTRPA